MVNVDPHGVDEKYWRLINTQGSEKDQLKLRRIN